MAIDFLQSLLNLTLALLFVRVVQMKLVGTDIGSALSFIYH